MTDVTSLGVCPLPKTMHERVQLGHGSGGRMSMNLLRERFLPAFANDTLRHLGDGAVVPIYGGQVVVSTDSFVVRPLEFPGGNIGSLAVHGTLNDVAMMGATPHYLSAAFILEEGLSFEVLDRIVATMASIASEAGVPIVTGDTKVVERGSADGMYINTTGVGVLDDCLRPSPDRARPGDAVIVSGPIARHGIAVLTARNDLGLQVEVTSDTANLSPLIESLRASAGQHIHVLRDPTRGGIASALNEIAAASGVGIVLDDALIPVPDSVGAACEVLGLDPLYVANEGIMIAVVPESRASLVLETLQGHELGRGAVRIGKVTSEHPGMVVSRTLFGSARIVDMLPGDQLPRIC